MEGFIAFVWLGDWIAMGIKKLLLANRLRFFLHDLSDHLDRLVELPVLIHACSLLIGNALHKCKSLLLLHLVNDLKFLIGVLLLLHGFRDLLEISIILLAGS